MFVFRQSPTARRRVLLLALLALGTGIVLACSAGRALAAPGPAFDGATPTVFVAQGPPTPTQLERAVESNGRLVFQNVGPATETYNSIAYDTADNYLYGVNVSTGDVVQIDANGGVTDLGAGPGGNVGAYDADNGLVYFTSTTRSALTTYNPATAATTTVPLSGPPNTSDMTYAGGYFWAVSQSVSAPTTTVPRLIRINPANGAVTTFSSPASLFPGIASGSDFAFGAAWTYGNGNLGFSENRTGNIYQIAIANPGAANPTFTLVSHQPGPPSAGNDGASIPGEPTDLVMHKTASSQIPDGGRVTYTLTVSNNGPGNSSGYTISDTLPAALSNPTTSSTGCSISGHTLTCVSANPLNAGATSAPVTVSGTVPNPFVTPITNTATVTSNEQDPVPGNNTGTATTTPSADVSIAKTASTSPLQPGQNETYTLTVHNDGPDGAQNVTASDPLPAGLSFVSASPGCTNSGGSVTCSAGDLASGASKTFSVVANAGSEITGRVTNTATVHSPTPDPNPGNNTGTTTTPVASADLSIAKTTTAKTVVAGKNETYKLVIHNNGPDVAENVTVSDPLPAGLSFVSASKECAHSGQVVTCSVPSLAAGSSLTYTVTAKVASSVNHALTNTATVDSPTPDPNPGNNTSTTTVHTKGDADLSIVKTASVPSAPVGGQVLYTLVVHNAGPSDATGVKVADTPGTGITLVSAKPSQGSCSAAGTCSLGTIASGGSAQVLVAATVGADAQGNVVNRATVTGNPHDPNGGNNTGTSTVHVPAPPQPTSDLQIVKHVNHARVLVGQTLIYTLTVTNHGPDAATNAKITDTPSMALKVLSAKTGHGTCRVSGKVLRCSLGKINNGKSVKITVKAKVNKVGTEKNAASTTSASKDPKPSNNLSKVKAKIVKKPKAKAVLHLHKTASPRTVIAGKSVTYHIKVSASKAAAHKVKVCDALPLGLTFKGATPKAKLNKGKECWTIKTLGKGKSRTFTVHARALKGTSGRKTNRATATAKGARTARAKATVRVKPAPKPPATPVTGAQPGTG